MWTRRRFLTRGTAAALAWAAGAPRLAGQPPEQLPDGSAAKGMITPAAQQAIDRGLAYLARQQNRDHFFGSFGTNQYQGNVAVTSLAGLAFMAGGHQPGRGPYGRVVADALDFVLKQEKDNPKGFLYNQAATPHGPMYGHGFGTLFLAEAYGMVHDRKDRPFRKRLRATLERAVRLILHSQNGEGGWRYQPEPRDADISVTICQIMALRAARNVGFSVPKSVADRCIRYVQRCQEHDGGFRYMAQGGGAAFARTAAGVAALYGAGLYKGSAVEKGLKYLMNCKPGRHFPRNEMHYFYGHYYAVQAMWTAGGRYWSEWYPAIRDDLLNHPRLRGDGSWFDQICSHYGTAMACIILQVPNNYLSILQK
jgi:hypothetical protein